MSTTLSVDVDFPIGTYAFVRSGHNDVTRVKIIRIGATWEASGVRIVYGVEGRATYKPDDLFLTVDAVFAAMDASANEDEDDEDSED